jgi:hypothetical protein
MHTESKLIKIFGVLVVFIALWDFGVRQLVFARAQVSQSGAQVKRDERGDLYYPELTDTRPNGKNPKIRKGGNRVKRSASNRMVTPKGKLYLQLGVTIGRGRPATEAEIKDSGIAKVRGACLEWQEQQCARRQDMVVERISNSTPIVDGTTVQMMIEYLASQDATGMSPPSNRVGYLYVINRVQFPDGKTSPPKLIYPTRQTIGGNGFVLPGRPVMLPGPQDLWQIMRNSVAAQGFETYLIIVSPEPLTDSQGRKLQGNNLADGPLALDEHLVANWVRLWGEANIQSGVEQGIGQLFRRREQAASEQPTMTNRDTIPLKTDLTPEDPQPEMGFRKAISPGGKMLITIKLPFRDNGARLN